MKHARVICQHKTQKVLSCTAQHRMHTNFSLNPLWQRGDTHMHRGNSASLVPVSLALSPLTHAYTPKSKRLLHVLKMRARQRQEAKKYQKNKKTNKNPATSQISPKNHSCQHCGGVIVTLKATEESALYITPKEYLITTTTTQESENKSPQT